MTSTSEGAYAALTKVLKEVAILGEVDSILGYDEQVFMPKGAAASRAEQKAVIAGILHAKKTGPEMKIAIDGVRNEKFEDEWEAANVRLAIDSFDKESRKSQELAEKEAKLESEAFAAWAEARKENDWLLFAPKLEEMFALKKELAHITRPEFSQAYDGALDVYERGTTSAQINEIFAKVDQELQPLLNAVLEAKKMNPNIDAVHQALRLDHPGWKDLAAQKGLATKIAKSLGYDFFCGRLDEAAHPFTGGAGPTDTRITTRYSTDNWLEGFSATVHEVGHALYEQGRPTFEKAHKMPVSDAMTMGIHESQSLLWERMVMQSKPFWNFCTPLFHEFFPHTKSASANDFYRAFNVVEPGLIRVNADELCYPYHIILRYNIERKLFANEISVHDIPTIWQDTMQSSLGVSVDGKSKDGALQDVHWSFGAIGYFPSYTLGAICAAQIFAAAHNDIPDLDQAIAKGDFVQLTTWLRKHIHQRGSLPESPNALLEACTGSVISAQPFLKHLRTKYSELYELSV
eukprot:CAMPEP_0197294046 /NCGR_PEP_ID=MMETSP0890-20130614/30847_1 /TAXON_ID=44058 ORGANISM="Aureoumbra lagunensis, Strain CCMP1510" /NCGR_SAMPLE_ID=MMETSP0890 /ASSEMBLY_ACC=CAM_ASM_000533 /LENGTH=517 /DNA_ID=CAMNT_0042769181 /DNA_START=163 /DNA_END=1716 /DNA_ORIENTATION=+